MGDTDKTHSMAKKKKSRRCLSCGTTENLGARRFCSIRCRQKLRYTLNVRTGLLHVLNTQYATFHFSDRMIVLNVLPYNSQVIYSFSHPRTQTKKPVDDFKTLCDFLGNRWWAEKKRTNKGYLASCCLLDLAHRKKISIDSVKPKIIQIPSVRERSLVHLKLAKSTMNSPELSNAIKRAYRRQAKANHPDLGGDAGEFRKIHHAYQELSHWAENPTFKLRQAFPDKWFYSRQKDKWMQPTRYKKWGN